jgi:hypothetical protein
VRCAFNKAQEAHEPLVLERIGPHEVLIAAAEQFDIHVIWIVCRSDIAVLGY